MTHRTLLLARHAEAGTDPAGTDRGRPLTAAGQADARAAGALLAAVGPVDLAVCSSARRTRETLDGIVAGGTRVARTHVTDDVYEARVADLLDVVRDLPDDARTVLLVGHAPGVPGLVDLLLADGTGSDTDRALLARGYAPATITRIGVDGSWADVDARQGVLLAVDVARA